MLTPLDQVANQNHLQIVKAIIPYIQPQNQKMFSIMIKMLELQNIIKFYNQNNSCIRTCSTDSEQPALPDILSDIREYCDAEEQGMIDQILQLTSTLELYSMLIQSSEDTQSASQMDFSGFL